MERGERLLSKFETHNWPNHCVVSLSKTLYPLLRTGLTQVPDMTENC